MSSECPECGRELYWQGGILPSVCTWKLQQPMSHGWAAKARKQAKAEGAAEERARVVAWLRRSAESVRTIPGGDWSLHAVSDDLEERATDIERGAHLEKT